jgi:hypothetical protein
MATEHIFTNGIELNAAVEAQISAIVLSKRTAWQDVRDDR